MKKLITFLVISLLVLMSLLACAPSETTLSQAPQKQAKIQVKTVTDNQTALTQGVNHIGFAVSDLNATTEFFTSILGWKEVGGDPSYPSRFVSDGKIFVTLWQTSKDTVAFNRKTNVGLHHFAMTVPDLETLDELHAVFLKQDNVEIEFAPEFLGNGPTTHMIIREPSGLRLEFIVPGGTRRETP